jgi:mono/diheme cytochrome c family protein
VVDYSLRVLRRIAVAMLAGAVVGGVGVSGQDAKPQAAARRVWDGLYSETQAERGRTAYMQACAECHMPDLGGHEYAGPLAGFGFLLKWQDASVAEVFGRVRTMPMGRPNSLTSQEYVDIVAFMLQSNGYPSGAAELTIGVAAQRF